MMVSGSKANWPSCGENATHIPDPVLPLRTALTKTTNSIATKPASAGAVKGTAIGDMVSAAAESIPQSS